MFTQTDYAATALTLLRLWNLHHHHPFLVFLLLIFQLSPATAQLQNMAPPLLEDPFVKLSFDRTIATVLVILVVVSFLFGFVSIYTRQCTERRIRGRFNLTVPINNGGVCLPPRGLDQETIDNFPNFVYSDVKGLKIGRVTLECAVCLNEFADDETLRLIPKCSHVFHRDCIDVWLVNHTTCPVCRANLFHKPGDVSSSQVIEISEPLGMGTNLPTPEDNHNVNVAVTTDSPPRVNIDGMNHPNRSKSTGFRFARLFSRSHSLDREDVDCERFTLTLPEQVQNQLMNSMTKSLSMTLPSARRGYRTRSVGRSYKQYEQFDMESRSDRKECTCTPIIFGQSQFNEIKEANKVTMVVDNVDLGEHSSDRLFYKE